MRYLLDTDTCIAAMRMHPGVVRRMADSSPFECVISSITKYELWTGVEKCADPLRERGKVEYIFSTISELPFDDSAAVQAATIRATLERQGTPIGPYDVLLAGQALANHLIMVTGNTREFLRVHGLNVENWRELAK